MASTIGLADALWNGDAAGVSFQGEFDPAALEYTHWGQIDMTADEVQAQASQGVTRLVVSPGSTELAAMQAEVSSFARRLGLG
jgi:uroporphyrinogen-III decarboxylase